MTRARIIALRCASVFALGTMSSPAFSASDTNSVQTVSHETAASTAIAAFYRDRGGKPFWFADSSAPAEELLKLLGTAEVDGIPRGKISLGALLLAVRDASAGDRAAVDRAELMLSEALLTYAQELQRDPRVGVIYVDPELKPVPDSPAELLRAAASASSLSSYINELGWMHPLYGKLRKTLISNPNADPLERHVLSLNLHRVRALPQTPGRHILVNTASQRLFMYENDKVIDEMKVVVGKPDSQTPLMNAFIRYAVLNPYWYVPSDLSARLAPKVIKKGRAYLEKQGYEVVSDLGESPRIINPDDVDWKEVVSGKQLIQLRQLPGPANSMGRIKFMFPNSQGVWLHDTPGKELFNKAVRLESAGCVRLEDAWRLGSWLLQRRVRPTTEEPELRLELDEPVPVYITYLTALPGERAVSFLKDPYMRDPPPLDQVYFSEN